MANIYTRGGDKGETSLLGLSRIPKDNIRVEAYGTMDEANAAIGLAYSLCEDCEIKATLHHLQKRIFVLGAELASDEKGREMLTDTISQADVDQMESIMEKHLAVIGPQKDFVIPGKNPSSAALHVARTVVRRGERLIVTYRRENEDCRPVLMKFVNRLSDTLFVLARAEEFNLFKQEAVNCVKEQFALVKKEGVSKVVTTGKLLDLSKKMAEAAAVKAAEINVPMVIAVCDNAGNPVLLNRMEDSLIASIDIATNKAYTSVALKMSTDRAADLAKENGELFGLTACDKGRMVVFGGGFPIYEAGKIIGGIGVSGGSVKEDMSVAQAGLAAIKA